MASARLFSTREIKPLSPRERRKNTYRPKRIDEVLEAPKIRRATLLYAFPEIAAEWNYKKNCGWGPEDFNYGSSITVWWQCPNRKSHVYATSIANRTLSKSGCRICNVGDHTDLRDFPEAMAQFDLKKNRGVDPRQIRWHERYHWQCQKNKTHRWVSSFNRRTGERCPQCKKAKTLASVPEVAKFLHPTKNGKMRAKDYRVSEYTLVWWKCPKGPDHEWQALIATKAYGSKGCPFCHGTYLSKLDTLASRYPLVAKEWHPTLNKPVRPKDISCHSTLKYWWRCAKKHEWYQAVATRTRGGSSCRECKKK